MMKQREVTTADKTQWSCVQAYAGLDSATADKAAQLSAPDSGTVTVVCTPSGGAQTVRLELAPNWHDQVADEELTTAIEAAQ